VQQFAEIKRQSTVSVHILYQTVVQKSLLPLFLHWMTYHSVWLIFIFYCVGNA